jgi:hypothetical protein
MTKPLSFFRSHILKTPAGWLTLAATLVFFPPSTTAQGLGEQLIAASQKGDLSAVESLISQGADVNTPGPYGQTAIFFAADRGHLEIVRYLIEKGANINAKDTFYSMTPMARAAMKNRTEVVRLLLDKGAEGAAQLMFQALSTDQRDGLKMLIESGRLSPKDLTAGLQFAERNQKTEMAEMLKAAGAKPPAPANFPVDQSTLQSYTGVYLGGRGGTETEVTVFLEDGKLKGRFGNTIHTLNATSKTEFRFAEQDTTSIEFQLQDGKVAGFLIQPGAQQFTRKEAK